MSPDQKKYQIFKKFDAQDQNFDRDCGCQKSEYYEGKSQGKLVRIFFVIKKHDFLMIFVKPYLTNRLKTKIFYGYQGFEVACVRKSSRNHVFQ